MNKNVKLDFTPDEGPETPYQKAKQEFDELIGSSRVQAKNWRLACFCTLIVLFVSVVGLIFLSTRSKVIPYIIEVNEHGNVRQIGKLEQVEYKPKLTIIKYFLSQFVSKIRSIPTDPVLLKKNFLSAYNFVTPKGRNVLNDFAKKYDPFAMIEKNTVSVAISNVVQMSEASYQVKWQEEVFTKNGVLTGTDRYTGIFNIIVKAPENEKLLFLNPMGIFIYFFDISKDIN